MRAKEELSWWVGTHLGHSLGQWALEGQTAKQTKCYATMFPVYHLLKGVAYQTGRFVMYGFNTTNTRDSWASVDNVFISIQSLL